MATQTEVYEGTARELIESVMSGFNATVFAYGATGSGKTHTMIGNSEAGPGVMVLTIRDMFSAIEAKRLDFKASLFFVTFYIIFKCHPQYRIVISYLEVYNEMIRDLLVPSEEQRPLELWEDKERGCTVAKLSEHEISSAEGVLELLEQGNARRRQSPTEQNAVSSRSHAVLQIRCEAAERTADVRHTLRIGKLSLIDLAGSERAAASKNVGSTQLEGANINKSLLALGNVINALCDDPSHARYVPYRNSKLTRLLRDSLGGNCRTVMIATVSAAPHSYEDTHNTLKYANRAKNIKSRAMPNEIRVDAHVADYKRIIDELRAQCAELRTRLQTATAAPPDLSKDSLRAAMQQALEDRTTLKRELAQIAEQEREQEMLMERHRAEVSRWEATQKAPGAVSGDRAPSSPASVSKARVELRGAARLVQQLGERRASLTSQLTANEREWERLEAEIARIPWTARRERLVQEARMCMAEAERNDLRREVSVLSAQLASKSEREARLYARVAYLEALVGEQHPQHVPAPPSPVRPSPQRAPPHSFIHPPSSTATTTTAFSSSSSSSSSGAAAAPPSLFASSSERLLRFASPAKPEHTPSSTHTTPSSVLPLRSALKKTRPLAPSASPAASAEATEGHPHAPSYAQGTLSSLKRRLQQQQQRTSAESGQKENLEAPLGTKQPSTPKLFHSLQ